MENENTPSESNEVVETPEVTTPKVAIPKVMKSRMPVSDFLAPKIQQEITHEDFEVPDLTQEIDIWGM